MNLIKPSLERRLRDRLWNDVEHLQVDSMVMEELRQNIMMHVDLELCRRLLGDLPATSEHNMMTYLIEARDDI